MEKVIKLLECINSDFTFYLQSPGEFSSEYFFDMQKALVMALDILKGGNND